MSALVIILALALLVAVAVLSRTPLGQAVVCDAVAVAPLVPRFRDAIASGDAGALAALIEEVGHDASVCALREHARADSAVKA